MRSSEGFACGSRPVIGRSRRQGPYLEKTGDERSKSMATPVGTGTKSRGIEPLTKRKAWKALQTHYKKVRELHLRNLFARSEEHTSELQSPCNLVCRLLLEKKKKKKRYRTQ